MKLKVMCCIVVLTVLFFSSSAYAACTVSATPVSFGSYDVFSPGPLDTTGTITIDCDDKPPPRVTISIGQSMYSGGFDPRAMQLTTGSELLFYNLYTDSNRTTIWGDGSGNTMTVQGKVKNKKPLISTVYGRVLPLQNVEAGAYNETLTITVVW